MTQREIASHKASSAHQISWDVIVPLATNRIMVTTSINFCLVTGLAVSILMSFLFAVLDEADTIPAMLQLTAIGIGIMWILYMFVMLVIFWNKMPMHFSLDNKNVVCTLKSNVGKYGMKLAVILGLFAKKPGLMGSGLIGMSQETTKVSLKSIAKVTYHPKIKAISLYLSWRKVLDVYCTDENYAQVAEMFRNATTEQTEADRKKSKKAMLNIATRTILTFIATIPMFTLPYPLEHDLLLTIIILCFMLATVWLVPFFGYVVIFGIILQLFLLIAQGLETSASSLFPNEYYSGFDRINGDEWILIAFYLLGIDYLIYSSWRAIKAKDIPALFVE